MKKLIIYVLSCLLFSCSSTQYENSIHIAAASSLQPVLHKLVPSFEAETGYKCYVSYASSGQLATQILQQAPYDIFLSADTTYPEKVKKGLSLMQSPIIYTQGRLIIWSVSTEILSDFQLYFEHNKHKLAIANPLLAPYGKAAKKWLSEKYGHVDFEKNLVFGESIGQVNQFILTKSVDYGFTAYSSLFTLNRENRGYWKEVTNEISPILQSGIVLNEQNKTSTFINFILSDSSQHVFESNGYLSIKTTR